METYLLKCLTKKHKSTLELVRYYSQTMSLLEEEWFLRGKIYVADKLVVSSKVVLIDFSLRYKVTK